jgi:beta-barrel assembly-enhancing protease
MFEKMENANRMNDSGAFPYLRSHPLTVERISEARSRLALAAGAAPADNLQHGLMGARARVLMDTSTDGLRRQQQRLAGAVPSGMPAAAALNEQLVALYGGALAAALLRDQANAEAAVAKALELLGGRSKPAPAVERDFKLLQAQLWLQGGAAARAIQLLDSPPMQPPTRPTMLLRAQAALVLWQGVVATADPQCAGPPSPAPPAAVVVCGARDQALKLLRQSAEALQSWLSIHASDPLAWGLLAQAEEVQGQRLRAMRAQAEARAALGDLNGAVDRLRAAQALVRSGAANDFIEASVIDARLRQLEGMRRQLAADMRGKLAVQGP